MFSFQSDNCTPFVNIFDIIFLFAAELEEPKIGIWGIGLTLYHTIPTFNNLEKEARGVTSFTWAYLKKALEISLYLAIRPRLTKFCM